MCVAQIQHSISRLCIAHVLRGHKPSTLALAGPVTTLMPTLTKTSIRQPCPAPQVQAFHCSGKSTARLAGVNCRPALVPLWGAARSPNPRPDLLGYGQSQEQTLQGRTYQSNLGPSGILRAARSPTQHSRSLGP